MATHASGSIGAGSTGTGRPPRRPRLVLEVTHEAGVAMAGEEVPCCIRDWAPRGPPEGEDAASMARGADSNLRSLQAQSLGEWESARDLPEPCKVLG